MPLTGEGATRAAAGSLVTVPVGGGAGSEPARRQSMDGGWGKGQWCMGRIAHGAADVVPVSCGWSQFSGYNGKATTFLYLAPILRRICYCYMICAHAVCAALAVFIRNWSFLR